MNKYKRITLFFLLFSLFNTKVYASCTTEEKNAFKKVESKYNITYEFDKTSKDYTITLHNPKYKLFSYSIDYDIDNSKMKYKEEGETLTLTYGGVPSGDYNIEIIGMTDTCDDTLKEIKLHLPKYNKYADDPLCEGYEEFVLCNPTYEKEIDYDTFVSRLNTYKKNKSNLPSSSSNTTKTDSEIITYIKDNLTTIIVIIVFIILLIITAILTAKSIKKSRRLE